MKRISADKIQRGKMLLAQGFGWQGAARAVGCSVDGLRFALDPEYQERRRKEYRDRPRKTRRRVRKNARLTPYKATPPETVIEERDHAMAAEVSITAYLFGDPKPGRSALDKLMAQTHG